MMRICVVGSGGVGKSCVIIRYLQNTFEEYYDPTMEDTYETEMSFNGSLHTLEIADTAGQEEFQSFLDSSLATGDAFMILFAINSPSSWNELKVLRDKIFQDTEGKFSGRRKPMIIVGNKKDLEEERDIQYETAAEYAASIRVPYIETSAKTGYNVRESFQLMMQEIATVQPDLLQKKRTHSAHSSANNKGKGKDCTIV